MSAPQAYRLVVIPQLLRVVFYPLTNQLVWAMLMTSLGVVVGLTDDLTGVTQALNVEPSAPSNTSPWPPSSTSPWPSCWCWPPACWAGACSVTEGNAVFTTSLTANDLLFLLQGAWTTLAITAMAMLIGTLLGVVFGLLRALLPRASLPLAALLDVFRSVPLLIQFVLLNSFKSILGLDWSAFAVACLVLGVYAAAYCTEVVRGGVLSVPPSVRRAARSLGLSYRQDLFHIVLPMAARVAFPVGST